MNFRIKTKWGKVEINPESVYEVNVKMNPYERIFRIDFVMDNAHTQSVDLDSMSELGNVLRRITNELQFIAEYKYKDPNGRIQFNEPRRMSMMREKLKEQGEAK
jgi:hypothetical protein